MSDLQYGVHPGWMSADGRRKVIHECGRPEPGIERRHRTSWSGVPDDRPSRWPCGRGDRVTVRKYAPHSHAATSESGGALRRGGPSHDLPHAQAARVGIEIVASRVEGDNPDDPG